MESLTRNAACTSADLTSILFGSTFWGSLAASLFVFLMVWLITFVMVWEPTTEYVAIFIAQVRRRPNLL